MECVPFLTTWHEDTPANNRRTPAALHPYRRPQYSPDPLRHSNHSLFYPMFSSPAACGLRTVVPTAQSGIPSSSPSFQKEVRITRQISNLASPTYSPPITPHNSSPSKLRIFVGYRAHSLIMNANTQHRRRF